MPEPTIEQLRENITEALRPIQDPEIRIGIIDLGLIYDIAISDDHDVQIKMTLTTPACPYGEMLLGIHLHGPELQHPEFPPAEADPMEEDATARPRRAGGRARARSGRREAAARRSPGPRCA